jgi:serine/threonine-protein phosphatase 4 regulatory subunit 1
MKRADDVNAGDPITPICLSPEICQEEDEMEWATGLFGPHERDIFRTEILQQVVIGMGRLDMEVHRELDDISREFQRDTGDNVAIADGKGDTGETSRAQPEITRTNDHDFVNPYFPPLASPFPPVPSTSSATPTLLSPLSSSSLGYSPPGTTDHVSQNHPIGDITLGDEWIPSAPRPTLPYSRNSTPWSSPDMSDSAHLTSSAGSASGFRHFYVEDFGNYGGYSFHEGSQNSDLYPDDQSDDQAAVGRLSSMSLMAAVAASGLFGVFLFLVRTPHLCRRLSW